MYYITMKKSEFLKIKESSWDSRIGRRSWKEQDTRNDLALVLKKQRGRQQKWKEKSESLEKKERMLRDEKLNLEIESISRILESWYKLTLQDLKFLESLSDEDLCKIPVYQMCWKPLKYVFLFEIFSSVSSVNWDIKSQLKEKAKEEVLDYVSKETKRDTFILRRSRVSIEKILEYITPEVFELKCIEWIENLSMLGGHYGRMSEICHKSWEAGIVTSKKYPYSDKYVYLYERCKNNPLFGEKFKSKLKEKAKEEVWEMVCKEISNDTFLYQWQRSTLEHIFEYIPQKTVANKLRWTWNMWTHTNVDVLLGYIDWFTELGEDYKKEIRREYNKEHGINDPLDEQEEEKEYLEPKKDDEVEENSWEEKTWDVDLDAYLQSRKKDVKAFISFMEKKEREKRRFDDWLEKEWWL